MIRVLLFTRVNPADGAGVQTVFRRLAASLRRQGHAVRVAWTRPDPRADGDTRCVPLPPLPPGGVPAGVRPMAGVLKAGARLALEIARFRPHVVNYHFITGEALYLARLKPLLGYRLVLSAHGSDVLRPKPWDAPLLPTILGRADRITAVSRQTAARLTGGYGIAADSITVIPNGVDADFWSAAADAPPLSERPPVVLSVGRLHPVKGHDVLLRAFAHVAVARPDARLLLIGDGGSRADLAALAATLGLADRVEFAGQLDPPAILARMAGARCVVLPSRSEGLPLSLLEAMSAAVPVVATRVGGIPEVVDERSAILVPPESPEALAEGLVEALAGGGGSNDRVRRARARARQFAAAVSDEAYARCYASACGRRDLGPESTVAPARP